MRDHVFTRPIFGSPRDGHPQFNPEMKQALAWLLRIQEKSGLDMDVLDYPATAMLCAYEKVSRRPLLYVPIQKVMMLDALGPNPECSEIELAHALAKVIETTHYESYKAGMGEVYFPCADQSVIDLAKRHHFQLMDYEVEREITLNGPDEQHPQAKAGDKEIVIGKAVMPFFKLKVYK